MKKNLILLVVLGALGAFAYFYQYKGVEEREAAKTLEESLLRIEDTQVTGLEIRRGAEPAIDIVRAGDSWRLTAPVESSVDRFVVDALVRDLVSAKRVRTLESVGDKLAEFGLEQPQVEVAVDAAGERRVVKVGKPDYTGNQVYVQLEGEDDVYITSNSVLTSADKDLKEWRSKTVLDYNQDEVQVVELQRPQGQLRLEKTDGVWRITAPIEDQGDDGAVLSLLSTVKYARIEDFVVDEAGDEDLAEYGFDDPAYELRLKLAGGDQWQTLQLGRKQGEKFYARDPSRRNIFTVRASLSDAFEKQPDAYRDKKIVEVKQDNLERFVMRRGESVIEICREGDGFVITQPESEKGKSTAPYKFWYPVTDAKFDQLDDTPSPEGDPRFANPDIRLEVTTRDGESHVYEFVQQGSSYLARKRKDGRSGTISLTDFEKLKLEAPSLP